ncbi:MAG: TIGR00725 family protein [Bacteroidia bacterium]
MRIPQIALIGPNDQGCTPEQYHFGEALGRALARRNLTLVCGGRGGWMEAVCKGAKSAPEARPGQTVGILPDTEAALANPYCDIVIPTAIGFARNSIVVNSGDLVIAAGGGAGTLSELAFAWHYAKPVICYTGFGGWSAELAGRTLDAHRPGRLLAADSMETLLHLLDDWLAARLSTTNPGT